MTDTKTAKAPKPAKNVKRKAGPPAPKGGKKAVSCQIKDCKRAYRAKGYCFFHYKKWRRGEIAGKSTRWDTCNKPECKKRLIAHGLCQEHYDAWKGSRMKVKLAAGAVKKAPAAEAAETPAA
jgi:hypothetical protein